MLQTDVLKRLHKNMPCLISADCGEIIGQPVEQYCLESLNTGHVVVQSHAATSGNWIN